MEEKNDAREAVVASLQIVAVPIGCGEILQGSNISTGRPAAVKSEKQIYIQSGKVGSIQKLLDAAKCKKLTQSTERQRSKFQPQRARNSTRRCAIIFENTRLLRRIDFLSFYDKCVRSRVCLFRNFVDIFG